MLRRITMIAGLAASLAVPGWAQDSETPDSGDANVAAATAEERAQRQLPDGTTMRLDDLRRLSGLDRDLGAALRQAFAEGASDDLDRVAEALRGTPLPPADAKALMVGAWSCQMIKIGGVVALTVYTPFSCEMDEDGHFQKLTGSQRTVGRVQEWDGQLIYLGTAYVTGQTPLPYAETPEDVSPANAGLQAPDAGIVEMTGADRGRILLPSPYVESRLNLLVLRR